MGVSLPPVSELRALRPGKRMEEGHLFLIDKPLGWTSFDVVAKVRTLMRRYAGLRKLKVGHAGTLDPMATGLMVVCCGRATRAIAEWSLDDKRYEAGIILGATTLSHDTETPVESAGDTSHITEGDIREALQGLTGLQAQRPPLFSAKRVDGKRAYDMARKGVELELQPVQVRVDQFDLLEWKPEHRLVSTYIHCSKGTYVRALARDLGELLGCGAYLSTLRRVGSGQFSLSDALTMRELEEALAAWSSTLETAVS